MVKSKVPELEQYWSQVLDGIKTHHGFDTFNFFFADTFIYDLKNNELSIFVSTNLAKNIISNKFKDELNNLIKDVFQTEFVLKFIVEDDIPVLTTPTKQQTTDDDSYFPSARIRPEFTFQNFVVGLSNKEASQAALMMASIKNRLYNPLFVYSDAGLGKTHLLNAIGNYLKDNSPNLKVLYISSSDFVSECIKFFQNKENHDHNKFRDYFRGVDVLLIDDVQMLQKHTAVEGMFFTIFEDLTNDNKPIILASDKHPDDLRELHPRLTTRFGSGLLVNILKPDVPTGVQILKSKIRATGLSEDKYDNDALEYMASNRNNVRDLESILNRVVFYTVFKQLSKDDRITLDFVHEAIDSVKSNSHKGAVDERRIINEVADYYNFSPSQLVGKSRVLQIALARHVAMYLIRNMLDTGLVEIGRFFGGVHHTTVMNAIEKVSNMWKADEATKTAIATLKTKLKKKPA